MSKMKKFERFVEIRKVDEDQQMVYGYASTPDLDSDGEVIALDGLAKSLPNYMKFPTIREMHQPKAIGVTKEAEIKDKGLWIGAKIVDSNAWKMVKEGVYKAFSIGGRVVEQVDNVISQIDLIEISLVDVPANKHAVIEVWKSGKVSKSAETVYSLSNLMIQLKDVIAWHKALGKNTKKLEKALDDIKKVIAVEAGESEQEAQESLQSLMLSDNPSDLEKVINSLDRLDFGDNKVAEALRKVVKLDMSKKAEELKKAEAEETEVPETEAPTEEESTETPAEETPEGDAPEGEEPESEEAEEAEEETEAEETEEEDKEVGDKSTMTKLEKADSALDEISKKEEAEEPVAKAEDLAELTKTADLMVKMVEVVKGLSARIDVLEGRPAPTKAKAAFVHKNGVDPEEETEINKKDSKELESKKARLQELEKLYDELGPNAFAKQGHSREAVRLQEEVARMEGK